jgi:O-antigen/teichoic acid export membrane protein
VYVGFINDLGLTILGARELGRTTSGTTTRAELLGARVALTMLAVVPVALVVVFAGLDAETQALALVLTVGFAISAINLRWLLQAEERFGAIAVTDTIASSAQLLAVILIVHSPADVVAAAGATVLGPAVATVTSLVIVHPSRLLIPQFGAATHRLIRRAAPLGIATIATAIYYSADSILIGVFRGPDEVGYYAAAYRIVLACLTIPFLTHSVALPLISRLVRERSSSLDAVLLAVSRWLVLLALPVAVGATIVSPTIVATVYGTGYDPAGGPLGLLIWTCFTVSANVPFAVLLLARKQDAIYMRTTLLGAAANVILNVITIPAFGMLGAAWSTLAAEAAVLAAILWMTRDLSITIIGRAVVSAAPAAAIMAILIWPIRTSAWAIPLGVLGFAVAAVLTRAVPESELRSAVNAVFRRNRNRGERQSGDA